jgi:peptidoglycan/xylan/chitin deacetylase (PgdA/CDA1 family)
MLALGGAAVVGGALSAAGLAESRKQGALPSDTVLAVDEADPTASARYYTTANGIDYVLAEPPASTSPVAWPTATPTPIPIATAIPAPGWTPELLRQVASRGPDTKPYVALTIDDGWSFRDEVLEVLKKRKLPLTFFLAGRPILNDKGFVARALNAGCEIANHTWDHYDLINKTPDYVRKDLQDFEDLVKAAAPGATTQPYMRPSGGLLNQMVVEASANAGYRPILWNVSTGDGSNGTTPAQMTAYAVNNSRPGSIILMHFGERAVIALPAIIDGLRAKGLEPVTLTRLFAGA